jgi:uncharacterized protein (TIGR01244 family)
MEIIKITDDYSVTAQISEADLAIIAKLGFKTIICNRPDKEGGDTQPMSDALKTQASALGIAFAYIPFSPGQLTGSEVQQFATQFKQQAKPILGFCKTGNRAKTIFTAATIEA